jgi:hypothetical protein
MREISSRHNPLYESVPTIFFHHDQFWAGTPAPFLDRLYNDFDYRRDDVWLLSYPRSGTAWTYELLSAVRHLGDIAALKRSQSEGSVLKFLPLEVGCSGSVQKRLNAWKALPSPRVIPTHLPCRLFPKTVREKQCKRVYVMRHPKDVAVSFYHFHRSHELLGHYQGTWDGFLDAFLSGRTIYGSWFDHTSEWWSRIQEDPEEVLVLFYEDLQEDLPAQIRRIGAFLEAPLPPHGVAAIADHCSFKKMSTNPFTNREGDPVMDFSIARFLRKGVVGDWRNHFTEAQNARFDAVWDRKMGKTALRRHFAMLE